MCYISKISEKIIYSKKLPKTALAGVAQWIECQPANQRVSGLIPSHIPGSQARSPVRGT